MRSLPLQTLATLGLLASAYCDTSAHRETIEEAALHARDLIAHRSDGIATFMSTFPSNYSDSSLASLPIGGLEYFAASDTGDMYILAMPVSKQISNAEHAPHHNATMSVKDEAAERKYGRFGATDRNRAVFFGSLERIPKEDEDELRRAERAFGKVHRCAGRERQGAKLSSLCRDAKAYFPGKGPHYAYWSVFKVERIYWIGGFGEWVYLTN